MPFLLWLAERLRLNIYHEGGDGLTLAEKGARVMEHERGHGYQQSPRRGGDRVPAFGKTLTHIGILQIVDH